MNRGEKMRSHEREATHQHHESFPKVELDRIGIKLSIEVMTIMDDPEEGPHVYEATCVLLRQTPWASVPSMHHSRVYIPHAHETLLAAWCSHVLRWLTKAIEFITKPSEHLQQPCLYVFCWELEWQFDVGCPGSCCHNNRGWSNTCMSCRCSTSSIGIAEASSQCSLRAKQVPVGCRIPWWLWSFLMNLPPFEKCNVCG